MANSNQTGNTASKDAAKKMIQELTDYAPHTLLFAMLATFAVLGYLQYEFYKSVFSSYFVAAAIPIIVQAIRFAAGLASANFFKMGKVFMAMLVMVLSVWLTYFEHTEVGHISKAIAENFSKQGYAQYEGAITYVLVVIVWVGPVLELFMGLTLGAKSSTLTQEHDQEINALNEQIQKLQDELANVPKVDVQQYLDEIEFLKNQMDQLKASGLGNGNAGKPKKPNGKPVKI